MFYYHSFYASSRLVLATKATNVFDFLRINANVKSSKLFFYFFIITKGEILTDTFKT